MKRGLASFRVTLPLVLLAAGLASAQPPDPPTAASHRQGSADAHHPASPRANSEELGLTEAIVHSLPSAVTRPITINNYIDEFIFAKIRRDHIPHAELCSDSEFLRRVSLDLMGRLPEPEKIRDFVKAAASKKARN